MILHPQSGRAEETAGAILAGLLRAARPLELLAPPVAFVLATRLAAGGPLGRPALTALPLLVVVHLGGFLMRAGFRGDPGDDIGAGRRERTFLIAGGVVLSAAALALAIPLGREIWSVFAAIFVIALAEAHPAIRWGERRTGGVLAAASSRGFLSFDAGLLTAAGALSYWNDWRIAAGALVAVAMAVALHLLARR